MQKLHPRIQDVDQCQSQQGQLQSPALSQGRHQGPYQDGQTGPITSIGCRRAGHTQPAGGQPDQQPQTEAQGAQPQKHLAPNQWFTAEGLTAPEAVGQAHAQVPTHEKQSKYRCAVAIIKSSTENLGGRGNQDRLPHPYQGAGQPEPSEAFRDAGQTGHGTPNQNTQPQQPAWSEAVHHQAGQRSGGRIKQGEGEARHKPELLVGQPQIQGYLGAEGGNEEPIDQAQCVQ